MYKVKSTYMIFLDNILIQTKPILIQISFYSITKQYIYCNNVCVSYCAENELYGTFAEIHMFGVHMFGMYRFHSSSVGTMFEKF